MASSSKNPLAVPARLVQTNAQLLRLQIFRIVQLESFAGLLILGCVVVAMVWANLGTGESYQHFWHMEVLLRIGAIDFGDKLGSFTHWINDGLMVIFFFVVGLETKRELVIGELSSLRRAALPIITAIGGMLVPAMIFLAFNAGSPAASGWAIPTATDIAFALVILYLAGRGAPLGLTIFLTTLAVADDIGAIVVIAAVYSSGIDWYYLSMGGLVFLGLLLFNWLKVKSALTYAVGAVVLWYCCLHSGIHATVAGVLAAFAVPLSRGLDPVLLHQQASSILDELDQANLHEEQPLDEPIFTINHNLIIDSLNYLIHGTYSTLDKMEHALKPWVNFLILPLFALSNAGVRLDDNIGAFWSEPLFWGIFLGLLVGKQLGIFAFAYIAVKAKIAELPQNTTWLMLYGVSILGGIGFTMSLFVNELCFSADPVHSSQAKLAILLGTICSGLFGYLVIRKATSPAHLRP
jgi:Na+:H+ antiporter, NhaA family